ncbi:hypothetical protein SAY86_024854 [Trapa natans]|uniref:Membrane-associated kinase regulator 5 n=1 Tax=Trapa natans TaxID=22666 RepID=A0AAN7RBV2_TRANT|nr:hypothetical protein SAY86_024854 [Trapa natans]
MTLASPLAMEALSFKRLWRPITSISSENRHDVGIRKTHQEDKEEEEEDSFFELELTTPDLDPEIYGATFASSESVQRKQSTEKTETIVHRYHSSQLQLQSKRKILPIESSFLRPQPPIPLLKSGSKFRVFKFRRSKSELEAKETDRNRGRMRKLFTLRFILKKIEPATAITRDHGNLRKNENNTSCSGCPLRGSNAGRLSKEVIRKYLGLVRPLYVKVSKRQRGGVRFTTEISKTTVAPCSHVKRAGAPHSKSMAPARSKVETYRQPGKSKSPSVPVIVSPARRDDSLLQQHDGIESAILHCKRSFSSSRDLNPPSPSSDSARSSRSDRP